VAAEVVAGRRGGEPVEPGLVEVEVGDVEEAHGGNGRIGPYYWRIGAALHDAVWRGDARGCYRSCYYLSMDPNESPERPKMLDWIVKEWQERGLGVLVVGGQARLRRELGPGMV
jgi:hypothetical protein